MILVYFFFPGRSARPAEEVTFLRILVTTTEFSPDKEAIRRVKEITGKPEMVEFVKADVTNKDDMERVLATPAPM